MMLSSTLGKADTAPAITITDKWKVNVAAGTVKIGKRKVHVPAAASLQIAPAELVYVKDEIYQLPLYNEKGAPWGKGAKLTGLATHETTAPDMLVLDSLRIKSAPGDSQVFKQGVDYDIEPRWATIGRLPGGSITENQKIYTDYSFGKSRIDSIIVNIKGSVSIIPGKPNIVSAVPPEIPKDSAVIANIWVPGRLAALTQDNIYPIIEADYPKITQGVRTVAEKLLPKSWAKLKNGLPLNILAWGDSVTDGGQASDPAHQYQNRFEVMLQKKFPAAAIHLSTVAWGGRNTDSFLKEPAGSSYNFNEKVIGAHPDLIVMEFVNDAYMTPEIVEEKYSYLLKRFQEIGAEWIILTPHYVRPDWMNAPSVRVEADPRPYVAGLHQFAERHKIALADASLRWGHLVKEGIPYITLLSNSINHPNDHGHEMFAQSLMELFGGP